MATISLPLTRLQTAVIVSLLTDRLDDTLDGTNDRRGWWADMVLPLASAPPAADLWLAYDGGGFLRNHAT
jgi:phage gp46-like protein